MQRIHIPHLKIASKVIFWFSLGAVLGLFFFVSFVFFMYQRSYRGLVYPGIYISGVDFGGKSQNEVRTFFTKQNGVMNKNVFVFRAENNVASISARTLDAGYDAELLSQQAMSLGRSDSLFSNLTIISQAYINGVQLDPSYKYSEKALAPILTMLKKSVDINPVDALFTFQDGKVVAFRLSKDGKQADIETAKTILKDRMRNILLTRKSGAVTIAIPVKTIRPETTTDEVNKFGITELFASGTSLFHGSIPERIYNITLSATRLNGILIAPNETFSFVKAVGDISKLTGYKQAYVIQNGRTVLGDGGGVCQVSTTFFRAVLHAGFPIVERNAHAYRVHYYEEDEGPGIDAAIYSPTVDLKFKNDSGHYLLIQTIIDPEAMRLTFELYGTKDAREVSISRPVILSQSPAPEALYQDDPSLPKGQVKQVDFAAPGANVYFTRTVKKDGKVLLADKFSSSYRPWQAIYLRGTKE